jgi:hypothetical protein
MTTSPQIIALAAIVLFLFVIPLAWALFWSGPGKRATEMEKLLEDLDTEPPFRLNKPE